MIVALAVAVAFAVWFQITSSHGRGELGALVLVVAACSSGPKGPGRDAWQKARTIAESHLREKYGEPPAWKIDREHEGTPFLFHVRSSGQFAVLVHQDQVFTQQGLAGLDRYLREARCVEQRTTNVDDMMLLLQHLGALPPTEQPMNWVRKSSETTGWRPRLEFLDGGRGELHLFYINQSSGDAGGDGDDGDTVETYLTEWTLSMDPGQAPVWREQARVWNHAEAKFADVDHAD